MLALESGDDVGDGEAVRLEARFVQPDPDAALAVAAQEDVADARNRLKLVLQAILDPI